MSKDPTKSILLNIIKIEEFINKRIRVSFPNINIEIALSQYLFSSFDIDRGTRLLLNTIFQNYPNNNLGKNRFKTILDIGCGTGIIGIALAKSYGSKITMRDRDSLALSLTAYNLKINNLTSTIKGGIDFLNLDGTRDNNKYHLIVSNLPAKAGARVLTHIIYTSSLSTLPGGLMAFVVIKPIASLVQRQLETCSKIIYRKDTKDYVVFHSHPQKDFSNLHKLNMDPYKRLNKNYELSGISYTLKTVYGLPSFDSVSINEKLLSISIFKTLKSLTCELNIKSFFIWNPGQGHLPIWIINLLMNKFSVQSNQEYNLKKLNISLASRDALQLLNVSKNLQDLGILSNQIQIYHSHSLLQTTNKNTYDLVILQPEKTLNSDHDKAIIPSIKHMLGSKTILAISGPAQNILRISSNHKELNLIKSTKRNGIKTQIFQKR